MLITCSDDGECPPSHECRQNNCVHRDENQPPQILIHAIARSDTVVEIPLTVIDAESDMVELAVDVTLTDDESDICQLGLQYAHDGAPDVWLDATLLPVFVGLAGDPGGAAYRLVWDALEDLSTASADVLLRIYATDFERGPYDTLGQTIYVDVANNLPLLEVRDQGMSGKLEYLGSNTWQLTVDPGDPIPNGIVIAGSDLDDTDAIDLRVELNAAQSAFYTLVPTEVSASPAFTGTPGYTTNSATAPGEALVTLIPNGSLVALGRMLFDLSLNSGAVQGTLLIRVNAPPEISVAGAAAQGGANEYIRRLPMGMLRASPETWRATG